MGVVYLARDLRLQRPVALKVPSADRAADPAFRARFLREARTAAALLHPNIVPIYAVHEVGELIFIAMAYVAGETLDQRIERDGALSPETAARLLGELADALAYAHARGVVHRDVKPDNILLDAASGRALLSDFGIARMSGDGRSSAPPSDGGVAGPAAFMSPEQARGEPVDSRSDLYSLGVVGYYALTGRLPSTGETDSLVLSLHATTPPPPHAGSGAPPAGRRARLGRSGRCPRRGTRAALRGADVRLRRIGICVRTGAAVAGALRDAGDCRRHGGAVRASRARGQYRVRCGMGLGGGRGPGRGERPPNPHPATPRPPRRAAPAPLGR